MVSFRPGGGGADRCSGAWKGCCAGYWKRGEAWCQGDLWKCRRRPADSAAIVPCFEASLRGYTEALCCSGLPSLSRFLLRASPSAPLQGSLGVGLSDQPGVLPLLLFLSSLRLILLSLRFSLSCFVSFIQNWIPPCWSEIVGTYLAFDSPKKLFGL